MYIVPRYTKNNAKKKQKKKKNKQKNIQKHTNKKKQTKTPHTVHCVNRTWLQEYNYIMGICENQNQIQ